MVASLLLMIAPARFFTGWISVVQFLVPFQHASTALADFTQARTHPRTPEEIEAEELGRIASGWEHQVTALNQEIAALREEVEILTATRLWEVDGRRMGAQGRLIPAKILTPDLFTWRESRLINAGSVQGVRPAGLVASRWFTMDLGDRASTTDGLAILQRETLVGFVQLVGTQTARVRLVCDVATELAVLIGRASPTGVALAEGRFWMMGRGNGVMHVREVDRREIDRGAVAVDDLVLADPDHLPIPVAMVVGRIERIEPDRDKPLLVTLVVHSVVNPSELRRVYVFDPHQRPES